MGNTQPNPPSYIRLLMYLAATLFVSISMGMNAIIFPMSMEGLDFSEFSMGFVLASETSALLLICFSLQWIFKKIGLYITLVIALFLRMSSLYFIASAEHEHQWLGFVFIHGAGAYLAVLLLQIFITSMRFKKHNTVVNATYGMMISLGYSIGPFLVEASTDISNDSHLYTLSKLLQIHSIDIALSVFFSLIAGIIMLLIGGKTPRQGGNKPKGLFGIIANAPGVYGAIAYCGVVIFGITAFITIYGIRNQMEVYAASMLLVAFITGCIVLEPVYAWISAHFDLRHFLFTNIFVSLVFSAFLPLVIYDFYQSAALLFLWGGANASCYSVAMSILLTRFKDGDLVAANAAFSLMDSLGGTVGIILIGIAMDRLGSEGLAYVMMMASVLYFSYGLTRYKII